MSGLGISSLYQAVTEGILKGSILGPLLFRIYVNDLPSHNKNLHLIMYANVTAVVISDRNDLHLKINHQKNLDDMAQVVFFKLLIT